VAPLVWIAPSATLIVAIQATLRPDVERRRAISRASTRHPKERQPRCSCPAGQRRPVRVPLSWGNFPLSLFTTGADSTLPKWLYAKMVSGYSPQVPALGMLAVASSIALVLIAMTVPSLLRALRAMRADKT